ncbi:MAG: YraN family protein [Dysgonamonadaceae bacterium]|jgi:putative endonuclease|nr:YraN family protein [Dysgonamonadaceae bacterium]
MAQHNELGKHGENLAVDYLQNRNYRILHRNWRRSSYELDIVACTDEEIVFVEVKTRSSVIYSSPEEAVNNQKINHLIAAADLYVKIFDIDLPARFDIISIVGQEPNFDIDHIEDAFYPPVKTYRK